MSKLVLSTLSHTWILDLDGTIVKHNGYLIDGQDSLLPGVEQFINSIPSSDYIIILTARKKEYKEKTIDFLKRHNIRYNELLFEIPTGERIIINDNKPSGLTMGYSVCVERDKAEFPSIIMDKEL